MKRLAYLTTAALVAMMIVLPAAMAQQTVQQKTETTTKTGGAAAKTERTMETTQPLPNSGGPAVGTVLLPASALLLGSGVLAYGVLRRRR